MNSVEQTCGVLAIEALVRALPSPAAAVDAAGAVLLWNDAAAQVFGWSATERVGLSHLSEQPGESAAFAGRLARALAGETVRGPVTRTRRDGRALALTAMLSPLRGEGGAVVGALEVLAEDPAAAQARGVEAVGQIAGGLAHDFNDLLTVIRGYSEALLPALAPRPELRDMALEIAAAAERAERLTRRLQVLARRRAARPRRLDLNAVIAGAIATLGRVLGDAIELSLRLQPDLGDIHADPALLELVLVDLAVNAREAMPDGGRLRLETAAVARAPACSHTGLPAPSGPCVVLRVRDSGDGIDAPTRARLFEPFFTTRADAGGAGLGLTTVLAALREAGGGLRVESAPGRGASFEIFLPRHAAAGG